MRSILIFLAFFLLVFQSAFGPSSCHHLLSIDLWPLESEQENCDFSKTAKMSFRYIGFILKRHGLSHGITTTADNNKKFHFNLLEQEDQAFSLDH